MENRGGREEGKEVGKGGRVAEKEEGKGRGRERSRMSKGREYAKESREEREQARQGGRTPNQRTAELISVKKDKQRCSRFNKGCANKVEGGDDKREGRGSRERRRGGRGSGGVTIPKQ